MLLAPVRLSDRGEHRKETNMDDSEKQLALANSTKPTKTWFFERGDGFVFACEEAEAWGIMKNRGEWMRRDFKFLGMSDGTTYFEVLKNAKKEANELSARKTAIARDLSRYLDTRDDLKFKQLKDDTDEMVIKVGQKIDELQKESDIVENELKNITKNIVDRAFKAELEKARGNMTMPSNADVITPIGSQREVILRNMPR